MSSQDSFEIKLNIKPFIKFEHFLKAAYVVYNYSHLSITTLSNLIKKITNMDINVDECAKFKSRLSFLQNDYGIDFFLTSNSLKS